MGVPLFPFGDDIRQLYQDGIDTLALYLARPCKFVLPGVRSQCPNCTFDPSSGRSAGVYNGTGPRPFAKPPCPVCHGTGYDPADAERTVVANLSIDRDIRPDRVFPPGFLTSPATVVEVEGTSDLIPLLQAMRYVILDYQNARYTVEKHVLLEGTRPKLDGSIVPGRYFTAYLKQVE